MTTDVAPGETDAFRSPRTRRIRLQPQDVASLPPHPLLQNSSSTSSCTSFCTEVLNEAIEFSDVLMHTEFQAKNKPAKADPSAAHVQLLTLDLLQESNGKGETWFGRRSIHEDASTTGTASYTEFENGLFHNHSENEGKYTPDVFDTRKILSYTAENGFDAAALGSQGWEEVDASIFEMGHKIPTPLAPRVFSVLVVRGKPSASRPPIQNIRDANGFVTAQIPVDLSQCQAAFYANGRHLTEGEDAVKKAKVVMGEYVSVERVRKQHDGEIVWEMATASDAKGNLPMFAQKMGVPPSVIKDVGLFIKWSQDERKS